MTIIEMREAVAEARHFISLYERGELKEKEPGELSAWRDALRDRQAWLDGYVRVPARLVKANDHQMRLGLERALQEVNDMATMYTQLKVIQFFRSQNLMNHSPLRPVENKWLQKLFAELKRISRFRIFLEFDLGHATTEELGGHANKFRQLFKCRNCPDSRSKKDG